MFASFRTSLHNLKIERKRLNYINRANRICKVCNLQAVEDELHFLLMRPLNNTLRLKYIPQKYYN